MADFTEVVLKSAAYRLSGRARYFPLVAVSHLGGPFTLWPAAYSNFRAVNITEKVSSAKFSKRVNPFDGKAPVVSLLQRGGKVRSMHMQRVTQENLRPVLNE